MIRLSQLHTAIAANHIDWFHLIAQHVGGEVHQHQGVTFVYKPSPIPEVTIAFPQWSARQSARQSARESARESARSSRTLDEILDWCRAHAPIHQISCWCIDHGQPADLGARLMARGFGWGWEPHWMWLNLRTQTLPQVQLDEVVIQLENDVVGWGGDATGEALPYFEPPEVEAITAFMRQHPHKMGYFVAHKAGRVVGHCAALISESPIKSAGLYDVGVVPSARGRGIGLALVAMACAWAKAQGCLDVTLNSTPIGQPTYRRAGFVSLGHGQTWWMREADLNQPTLQFAPLTAAQIKLVEALGRGDVVAAEQQADVFTPTELSAPLLGRSMTLATLAQHMKQPAALDWLARHGADAAALSRTISRVPTRDVGKAAQFYTQRLGFQLGYHESSFAIITRGEAEFHLYQVAPDSQDFGSVSRMWVQQLAALQREFARTGAIAPDTELQKMPWGGRELRVVDSDGNTLVFVE